MFFTLNQIVSWLGASEFEIWINIIAINIFTFLLAFNIDDSSTLEEVNWWKVFVPLFVADGLNCYFCMIISIRMYMCGKVKNALFKITWSMCILGLLFMFKYFLCKKLLGQSGLEYSEILSPIFILLHLFAARACQMH